MSDNMNDVIQQSAATGEVEPNQRPGGGGRDPFEDMPPIHDAALMAKLRGIWADADCCERSTIDSGWIAARIHEELHIFLRAIEAGKEALFEVEFAVFDACIGREELYSVMTLTNRATDIGRLAAHLTAVQDALLGPGRERILGYAQYRSQCGEGDRPARRCPALAAG